VLKDNGLRLLLVGYESGNQQILHNIKKGMRVDVARRFTKDCHELGIAIHGTFILGLPGETKETIQETIRFAVRRTRTPSRSRWPRPTPAPSSTTSGARGLAGHGQRRLRGRARRADRAAALPAPDAHRDLRQRGDLLPPLLLPRAEDRLHLRRDGARPQMLVRRLREGVEFFRFLRERAQSSQKAAA
jgi:hypothetical protein